MNVCEFNFIELCSVCLCCMFVSSDFEFLMEVYNGLFVWIVCEVGFKGIWVLGFVIFV